MEFLAFIGFMTVVLIYTFLVFGLGVQDGKRLRDRELEQQDNKGV